MEEIVRREREDLIWLHPRRLPTWFTSVLEYNYTDSLAFNYYLSKEGYFFEDWEELIINRTPAIEEGLSELELIRPPDLNLHFPIELERFPRPGSIRIVNRRINDHILHGAVLFPPNYPVERYLFQSAAAAEEDIQLVAPYSRIAIDKLRNFVKYLEALIRYSLDVLSTKKLLLDHLNIFENIEADENRSHFNDNLETGQLIEQYIHDLSSIKRYIVSLATYHTEFDRQRHYLIEEQVSWETNLRLCCHRQNFGRDIIDTIESFLIPDGIPPQHETFVFRAPVQGKANNTVGFEDISGGIWGISTLRDSTEVYQNLYSELTPNYRVTNYQGFYYDLVRSCSLDIKKFTYCLSYEVRDYWRVERSPWSDVVQGTARMYTDTGVAVPYAWIEGTLITVTEREERVEDWMDLV